MPACVFLLGLLRGWLTIKAQQVDVLRLSCLPHLAIFLQSADGLELRVCPSPLSFLPVRQCSNLFAADLQTRSRSRGWRRGHFPLSLSARSQARSKLCFSWQHQQDTRHCPFPTSVTPVLQPARQRRSKRPQSLHPRHLHLHRRLQRQRERQVTRLRSHLDCHFHLDSHTFSRSLLRDDDAGCCSANNTRGSWCGSCSPTAG